MSDVVVVAGGVIPDDDHPALRDLGVDHVFTPGTPLAEIASAIRTAVSAARERA
jgi:methylmalonyl-CoA mutase cobalamin-binding domain/chain